MGVDPLELHSPHYVSEKLLITLYTWYNTVSLNQSSSNKTQHITYRFCNGWRFIWAHQLLHCLQADAYSDFVGLLQNLLSILTTPSESLFAAVWFLDMNQAARMWFFPWPSCGTLLLGWSVIILSFWQEIRKLTSICSRVAFAAPLPHFDSDWSLGKGWNVELLSCLQSQSLLHHWFKEYCYRVMVPCKGQC